MDDCLYCVGNVNFIDFPCDEKICKNCAEKIKVFCLLIFFIIYPLSFS